MSTSRKRRLVVVLGALVLLPLAFVLVLMRGNARSLPRESFVPPPRSSFTEWADVFAHAPRVTLVTLDTGAVHVPRELNLAESHPERASYVPDGAPLRVFAHLIRHPSADVLVDSGLDASFASDRYGNITRPARWLLDVLMHAPYSQASGDDVMSQLARLDAHPSRVFFTHLHMDHTAGVPALSAANSRLQLITGPHEADDRVGWFGFGHVQDGQRWTELDFAAAREMPVLGPAIDVFGDGSFWAVATPGHSVGHTSFVVNDVNGPVLLTGDACHFVWAFEHGVGPAGTDEAQGQASLDRLRAFAAAYPEVRVHTGHETYAALRESPQRMATSSR